MRLSCKPQSELGYTLWDQLLFSESHLTVCSIAARVSPRGFGTYSPDVARTFLPVARAVCIVCHLNYTHGSRLLPDLTDHFTTQADVGHASPLSVSGKPFRLTFILLSLLVRFTVQNLIEPHASLVVCLPANSFKFRSCDYTSQVAHSSPSLQHRILPKRARCLVSSVYCQDYTGI